MTTVTIKEAVNDNGVVSFQASCDGRFCGAIYAHRDRRINSHTAWSVSVIHVNAKYRRRGIATRLYEAAARAVCARRGRLASTHRSVGAHSTDFWVKQVTKGRAIAVRRRYGQDPIYVLTDCPITTLAGRQRQR